MHPARTDECEKFCRSNLKNNSGIGIETDVVEPRGDAPGEVEQPGVGGHQGRLVGAHVLDEGEERGPVSLGHGEFGAEVEQGDLADGIAGAFDMREAEGVVLLAGGIAAGSGIGAADVHNGASMADARANMRR